MGDMGTDRITVHVPDMYGDRGLKEGRYANAPLAVRLVVKCYGKSEAINFSNAKLSPIEGPSKREVQ